MTRGDWRSWIVGRGRAWTRLSCPICMLALVISGAVGIICITAINLDRTRTEQQSLLKLDYLADLARQRTSDLFLRIDGVLRDIASAAGVDADRAARAQRLAALLARDRRANPGLLALYVLGANGDVLASDVAPTLRTTSLLSSCLQDEKLPADQLVLKPAFAVSTLATPGVAVVCAAEGSREPGFAGAILAVLSRELISGQYADLLAGSYGAVTLRDEAGRVLAYASAEAQRGEAAEAPRPTGALPARGIEEVRRIEVPAAASVTVTAAERDILAGWWSRSALLAGSAVIVIAFLWLAALAVRACQRREAQRLERLTALSQDLRGTADRETLTRRLVAVAAELLPVVEVPAPEDSKPPNGMPERRLSLSVLRPDMVRIGAVTLQQRGGLAFSLGDLAMLRVLARITESAIQHATMLATATEATQRLREELQQATQAVETIQREMSDAAFALNADWCFTSMNRNAEKLFGEYREDLRSRTIWEIFPELVGSLFEAECRRAVREGHEVSFEWQWMRSDTWLTVHAFPHADGLAVYMQDISRLVAANDKLRQAAKMEAIGRLTGGIAHDFNNALTVILGNIETLDLEPPPSDAAREMLAVIKRAAENAAKLTHQLLAFAGRQTLSPQVVDVGRLVVGLNGLLRSTLGAAITLEIRCPPSLWPARVDPAQLDNAIINLALNARDAMPAGGRLIIEAANLSIRKPEADPYGEIKPGNYVVISVSDTGKGIPKELLGNVFEPFFSTKPSGRGTGLGLAMVYGFVNQSGGHVKITSEVGRGTTVRLYLPSAGEPRAAGEPSEPVARAPAADLPGGSETILVVEDSEGVREFVATELGRLGYQVSVAIDGPAALELIDRGLNPALLLTDVQLPGGMDGLRLAEQIQQRRREIKLLYMSGYVEDVDAYHGQLDPQTNLLIKPFPRARLAAMVRARLNQNREQPGRNSSAA